VNEVKETILHLLTEGLLLDHDSWPKFARKIIPDVAARREDSPRFSASLGSPTRNISEKQCILGKWRQSCLSCVASRPACSSTRSSNRKNYARNVLSLHNYVSRAATMLLFVFSRI